MLTVELLDFLSSFIKTLVLRNVLIFFTDFFPRKYKRERQEEKE